MGLGDWFDKVTDKIEAKGNQFIKKTGENIADTGRNFADTIAPRAPLAPEKRSAYLAKSRKETGANRYDPAANLSDAVLIEKRWSAQEKVRRHFGKTAGECPYVYCELATCKCCNASALAMMKLF